MTVTENTEANSTGANSSSDSRVEVRLASPLVAALEAAWAAIQHRHPEIPDVVIVMAAGSVGVPRGALKLGHFAAMRWTHATKTADTSQSTEGAEAGEQVGLPEVSVDCTTCLACRALDVLHVKLISVEVRWQRTGFEMCPGWWFPRSGGSCSGRVRSRAGSCRTRSRNR